MKILETIFSTIDENKKPNFAPMGLEWDDAWIMVRPYRQTQTYRNLCSTGYGVANISDDVLAYVQCALYDAVLPSFPAVAVPGAVYSHTCGWYELQVVSQAGTEERAELKCRVVHEGRKKDFVGFCRASNAIIEATVLATRLNLYPQRVVGDRMVQFGEIVEKTGGDMEKQAFQMIRTYIQKGMQ